MKTFLLTLITALFIFISINTTFASGECLGTGCIGGGQFPSGTQTTSLNTFQVVTTAAFAGDYAVYNVTNGFTYEWSTCTTDGGSATYDSFLSLDDATGASLLCASDNFCGDDAKIKWTANLTGTVRVLLTLKNTTVTNCASNSTFSTVTWRCVTCGLGSPANDDCTAAPLLTVNAGGSCGAVTSGNLLNATQSATSACAGTPSNDIWYKFTATAAVNHVITVSNVPIGLDPVIELLSGACNGVSVACADNGFDADGEIITASGLVNGNVYYIRVYDFYQAAPSATTFDICVTTPNYCAPSYSFGTGSGDFIQSVQLNGVGAADISNLNTGAAIAPYFTDYSATKSATLYQNTPYSVTVTSGTYTGGGESYAAWIDYNQDNDFLDAGEKLGEVTAVNTSTAATIAFATPATATVGTTTMRIRNVWSGSNIDPCTSYSFGEAEDYQIVISPCQTAGAPATFTTSAITTAGATLNWAAGTPAGTALVTYYWAIGTSPGVTYESGYLQRGTVASLSQAIAGLTVGVTYYWNVKAVVACNGTISAYGTEATFATVCTTPGAPVIGVASGISTSSATLNWTANVTAGTPTVTYYWAVGLATNVTYEANYVTRGTTTNLNAVAFGLTALTGYYYKVKAVTSCDGSISAYSTASALFTTTGVPTPIVTWDGSTSTNWTTASNWTPAVVPAITDNVIIPAGMPRYPVSNWDLEIVSTALGASRKCKSLHINAGAKVTFTGTSPDIRINGELEIAGEFHHRYASTSNALIVGLGGKIIVRNGGVLNIGSDAIVAGKPSGIIDQFNDLKLNEGVLEIDPGGKVFIMDNLVQTGTAGNKGTLDMQGGELWIKYYGDGSTNTLGWDVFANAQIDIAGGLTYICGQDPNVSAKMTDWSTGSTTNITGGTITLGLEQSSGIINSTGKCNFGGKALNHLIINRNAKSTFLNTNSAVINGDITITAGTFNANGLNISLAGNWTNNSAFTMGTGTVTLTGNNKQINGSVGTIFNNLTINAGALYTINPTGVTWPTSAVQVKGTFTGTGDITIAANKILDLYGTTNIFNGNITAISNYDATRDIDFNTTGSFSGTGSVAADIRVFSGTTTLGSNFTIDGNFAIRTVGVGFTMGAQTLTLNGNWTNNGTFTRGTGTVILAGAVKNINGTVATAFNDLTINSGASYTFNSTTLNMDVYGSFLLNGNFTIGTGNWLNLRAATVSSDAITINGTLSAVDVYNTTRDINTWNSVVLSVAGNLNADLRVYTGNTTLSGDATINGDLEMSNLSTKGTLTMTTNTLTLGGDFTNNYRFVRGTGTVKFAGTANRTIRTGCTSGAPDNCSTGTEATYNAFNNVIINPSAGMQVGLFDDLNSNMRVDGNLTIQTGILNTGSATFGNKLRIDGTTKVESGAIINVGKSGLSSGEVLETRGDLVVEGSLTTDRALIDGFSELKSYGSRLFGTGLANNFGVDIQVFSAAPTEQFTDIDVSGDMIIQTVNKFQNNDPNLKLTIHGNLYIYNNLDHNGTVDLYGNFREANGATLNANVVNISNSTFNMYGTKYINFNPSSGFGNLNIKTGIRSINELNDDNQIGEKSAYTSLDINGNLAIENGATLRMDDDAIGEDDDGVANTDKNISLAKNLTTVGTGVFDEGTGTVIFDGPSGDQFVNLANPVTNTLYKVDVNKAGGNVVLLSKLNISGVTATPSAPGLDLHSSGLLLNKNELHTASTSINSYMDGGAFAGYIISESSDNASKLTRTIGTSTANKFYPFATVTGATIPMKFTHNSVIDNVGDVSIATYPTGATNLPMPTFPNAVTHINTVGGGANSANMVNRYYQIDITGANPLVNGSATVNFSYDNTEVPVNGEGTDLAAQHWNGTGWDSPTANGTSVHTPLSNLVITSGIKSFSPFALARAATPLPIELLSFDAIGQKNTVETIWVTETEINNDYFIVQKSKDTEHIVDIGRVEGAGNSVQELSYHLTDESPFTGYSYYRLKQVDFDGTTTFSDWVPVYYATKESPIEKAKKEEALVENNIYLAKVYPNPTKDYTTLVYACKDAQKVQFMVFDITGRLILQKGYSASEGDNIIRFNLADYDHGTYIVVLNGEKGNAKTKVIKY